MPQYQQQVRAFASPGTAFEDAHEIAYSQTEPTNKAYQEALLHTNKAYQEALLLPERYLKMLMKFHSDKPIYTKRS